MKLHHAVRALHSSDCSTAVILGRRVSGLLRLFEFLRRGSRKFHPLVLEASPLFGSNIYAVVY
jgi:hypothetical protein